MDQFLTPMFLGPLGTVLLIMFYPYIQMARGKLFTYRQMQWIMEDRDAWRKAHEISEQARMTSAAQVEELLEHARLSDAIVKAIPRRREVTGNETTG